MNGTSRGIRILIVYYSRYGGLRRMAEHVAEGVRRVSGASVELLAVDDAPLTQPREGDAGPDQALQRQAAAAIALAQADALIVGTPAYFGTMASPLKRFFEDALQAELGQDRSRPWRAYHLHDKVGAAFVASGTPHGGNEQALLSVLTMFMHLRMLIVTPGQGEPILENPSAPYGATLIAGPRADDLPDAQAVAEARALGERVAHVTTWLAAGRAGATAAPEAPGPARSSSDC
jgi:NAD(P)H dehydrogenase (quinone)